MLVFQLILFVAATLEFIALVVSGIVICFKR